MLLLYAIISCGDMLMERGSFWLDIDVDIYAFFAQIEKLSPLRVGLPPPIGWIILGRYNALGSFLALGE